MEQLTILERICESTFDSLESGTSSYIFAAAVYDTWYASDNKLEKNLAERLVSIWEEELEHRMIQAYRATKYDENRPEQEDYYKKWLESSYNNHSNNQGLRRALINIWEKRYGPRR